MGAEVRARLWREIEEEFEEPVGAVVMGLREQGNSWRTVAGALGVCLATLQEWRKALGLPLDWHDKKRDESSTPDFTPTDERAQGLGYRDAEDAVRDMRFVQRLSLVATAGRLGVCVNTVVRYTPREIVGQVYVRSGFWWEVRRAQAREMMRRGAFKRQKGHPWRGLNGELFREKK
jgi:hypothetical protein